MAVDDVAVGACHAEGIENGVDNRLVVAQLEVVAFMLLVRGLVFYEIAFEGRHLRLVKQRAVGAAPQVKKIVGGILSLLCLRIVLEGGAYEHADVVEQVAAFVALARHDLNLFQRAVVVKRYGGVEQQVAVADVEHAAVLQEQAYVAVQLLAHTERVVELVHKLLLLRGKSVGALWAHGREVVASQGVLHAVEHDGALLIVDVVEEHSVLHVPFGMLLPQQSFLFKLQDGYGLVHEGYEALRLLVHA